MVARQGHALALPQAGGATGPPVMLFLGLVGDSAIFDLHPGISWAEQLLDEGFDVFLFDWGRPEAAEADHTLDTYLNGYFVHAVDAVRRIAGADEIVMGAYCMGALMLLLLLGSRDDVPCGNIVLFTPPCDFDHPRRSSATSATGRLRPADAIDETTGLVPEGAIRRMFRMLQPTSELVQYVTLWEHLWREDYVEAHRAVNHWAWNHRAMAGAAFTELITEYVRGNALMTGDAQTRRPSRPTRNDQGAGADRRRGAGRVRPARELGGVAGAARLRRRRGPPRAGRSRRSPHGLGRPTGDDARGHGVAQRHSASRERRARNMSGQDEKDEPATGIAASAPATRCSGRCNALGTGPADAGRWRACGTPTSGWS